MYSFPQAVHLPFVVFSKQLLQNLCSQGYSVVICVVLVHFSQDPSIFGILGSVLYFVLPSTSKSEFISLSPVFFLNLPVVSIEAFSSFEFVDF